MYPLPSLCLYNALLLKNYGTVLYQANAGIQVYKQRWGYFTGVCHRFMCDPSHLLLILESYLHFLRLGIGVYPDCPPVELTNDCQNEGHYLYPDGNGFHVSPDLSHYREVSSNNLRLHTGPVLALWYAPFLSVDLTSATSLVSIANLFHAS